jgi:hypothetical protein
MLEIAFLQMPTTRRRYRKQQTRQQTDEAYYILRQLRSLLHSLEALKSVLKVTQPLLHVRLRYEVVSNCAQNLLPSAAQFVHIHPQVTTQCQCELPFELLRDAMFFTFKTSTRTRHLP